MINSYIIQFHGQVNVCCTVQVLFLCSLRYVGTRLGSLSTQKINALSAPAQISADPPDINILPDYSSDPRVVTNLLDGVNHTRSVGF